MRESEVDEFILDGVDFESGHFFFFFSSRRRHTRWTGDWSSDVCSSDLLSSVGAKLPERISPSPLAVSTFWPCRSTPFSSSTRPTITRGTPAAFCASSALRSEERRVGKERRSRWWTHPQHNENVHR